MNDNVKALLGFVFLCVLAYTLWAIADWFIRSLDRIDPTLGAALIASGATVVSSVLIATYNARKAKERLAHEANREAKAKCYMEFMNLLKGVLKKSKDEEGGENGELEGLEEFFYNFTSNIVVYGGPAVVKSYNKWRSLQDSQSAMQLKCVDELLRAMRKDLGESNAGIEPHVLIGLYIIGGKEEIDESLNAPTGDTQSNAIA